MGRSTPKDLKLSEISVPAKVILFGEHSIVYPGKHAILWPVIGLHVTVTTYDEAEKDHYTLSDNDKQIEFSFSSLNSAKREFKSVSSYIKACVAIAHEFVSRSKTPKSLDIIIESTIPIGGFGSSASFAASIIKAIVIANNISLAQPSWYELVMEAEKLPHGNPSGADAAVVTLQHPVIVKKNVDGSVEVTAIEPTRTLSTLMKKTRIFHTGRAQQTTAEVVDFVLNQPGSESIIDRIEKNTLDVIRAIKNDGIGDTSWKHFININGVLLEELGVVPEECTSVMRKYRKNGAALKMSGGGALNGPSCGAVVAFGTDVLKIGKHERERFDIL